MSSIREISETKRSFEINESETKIGRGPFLGVTDKKVSRNHGTIKQVTDGVELKSIHINPCFYARKTETQKWMKLDKDENVVLHTGDIFSLLPKQYIYEVINTSSLDTTSEIEEPCAKVNNTLSKNEENKKEIVSASSSEKTSEIKNLCEKVNDALIENEGNKIKILESENLKSIPASKSQSMATPDSFIDGDKEVALPTRKKRKLPAWMKDSTKKSKTTPLKTPKTNTSTPKAPKTSTAKQRRTKLPSVKFDSSISENEIMPSKTDNQIKSGNNKSEMTSEDVEMVDISIAAQTRIESPQSKPSENKSQDFIDDKATGSDVENDKESKDASGIVHSSSSLAQSPSTTSQRSSCAYGASCYRKNPLHLQEFSHPGDTDYADPNNDNRDDDSNRPECPYGTGCYRRNPLHKKQYKHTKRVAPKRVAKLRAARKAKHDDSSSDDYDLDDSFLNDDSEDDVSVDEDSDWNPSQGSSNSKKARKPSRSSRGKRKSYKENSDSDATTDEDDLDDLVADAKKFANNRRMWNK